MNYRHAYHAGSFADVLKHAVLTLCLEHLRLKPAPFRVIDTHAGIGTYDLASVEAVKTGEWIDGIGRLLDPEAPPPEAVLDILAPYLAIVAEENPAGTLTRYPGSPLIALRLLRAEDRLMLTELHPEDCATLAAFFKRDAQVKVTQLDGWLALKSFLPPKERRGLVLIDPPYEARDELQRLQAGLSEAIRRFSNGTFILWYPVKDLAPIEAFHAAIAGMELAKTLRVELYTRDPEVADRLNGCGLLVVNPPWTLRDKLAVLLPFLVERLRVDDGAGWHLEASSGAPV
jgi:23S rRNA (adenine2030-N6)-methyltransferase